MIGAREPGVGARAPGIGDRKAPRRAPGRWCRPAALLFVWIAVLGAVPGASERKSHQEEVARFRAEYEAGLRAEDGYLSVAGLFFLKPGANTFGADPASDVVLPTGAAPARLGVLEPRGGRIVVSLVAPGLATLNGAPMQFGELRPASGDRRPDLLRVGRLTLLAHMSGERLTLRLRDPDGPVRRNFAGLRWFPVDGRYRIVGRFVPYPQPRRLGIVNIHGDALSLPAPGVVEVTVQGRTFRMEPIQEPNGRLWFIFKDATSGRTTYEAGRFLYTDPPRNGVVILDFNKAYSPPCAYNPYTTCPLPPAANRLTVPIEAGEMAYAGSRDH